MDAYFNTMFTVFQSYRLHNMVSKTLQFSPMQNAIVINGETQQT